MNWLQELAKLSVRFFPNSLSSPQVGEAVSVQCLHMLGNLALVSVGANSKFSNSLPRAKAENFRTTIEIQSPKLQKMAEITRSKGNGATKKFARITMQ